MRTSCFFIMQGRIVVVAKEVLSYGQQADLLNRD